MAEREKAAERTGKVKFGVKFDSWGKVKDGKDGDGNMKKEAVFTFPSCPSSQKPVYVQL